jgi:hypothetical protein
MRLYEQWRVEPQRIQYHSPKSTTLVSLEEDELDANQQQMHPYVSILYDDDDFQQHFFLKEEIKEKEIKK